MEVCLGVELRIRVVLQADDLEVARCRPVLLHVPLRNECVACWEVQAERLIEQDITGHADVSCELGAGKTTEALNADH